MLKISKLFFAGMLILCITASPLTALAYDAKHVDANVDSALKKFEKIPGSREVLHRAMGVLVFPNVFKAGIGLGGEYGEGALRIKGKTVDYYNTFAVSIGLQLGGQQKTIIMAFMQKEALENFRHSEGWKIGIDASVTVISVGAGGSIDSMKINEPIVAFVLDQKGLMYNLTLEGAKISKMAK